jgi:hypothetical protein
MSRFPLSAAQTAQAMIAQPAQAMRLYRTYVEGGARTAQSERMRTPRVDKALFALGYFVAQDALCAVAAAEGGEKTRIQRMWG